MNRLMSMMVLGWFVLAASFASAQSLDSLRPHYTIQQMWAVVMEHQAKVDNNCKACESEAAKILETIDEKKPRQGN